MSKSSADVEDVNKRGTRAMICCSFRSAAFLLLFDGPVSSSERHSEFGIDEASELLDESEDVIIDGSRDALTVSFCVACARPAGATTSPRVDNLGLQHGYSVKSLRKLKRSCRKET